MKLEQGSIAEKAGLKVHNLIVAVNGVPLTENEYALIQGIADMTETGKMTLTVERYGQAGTFEIVLDSAASRTPAEEGRERVRMTLRTPRGNVIIPVCRIPLFL